MVCYDWDIRICICGWILGIKVSILLHIYVCQFFSGSFIIGGDLAMKLGGLRGFELWFLLLIANELLHSNTDVTLLTLYESGK